MTLRFGALALLLVGCDGGVGANQVNKDAEFEEEEDTVAPLIEHSPVTETQAFGVDVPITVTVTDEGAGVLFVVLYYKGETQSTWERAPMLASGETWTGTIKGADMSGGGIDYYIEATDYNQNVSYDPEDGPDDPYHFRVE